MATKKMRLDRYLVHTGCGSRTEVQMLIKKKKVKVDGEVVSKPETTLDPETASVEVYGEAVVYQEYYHFIMHKPDGVLTATEDPVHETVLDLLEPEDQNKMVCPVGRLDKDTEGLLILTSDGKLNHALLSPKKHVDKVYYATLTGCVTEADCKAFEEGIYINENTRCMPAQMEIISAGDTSEVYITIREGKFHQIKRMAHAIGKEVTYLKRVKMGGLMLPEDLEKGMYRLLTNEELRQLKGE